MTIPVASVGIDLGPPDGDRGIVRVKLHADLAIPNRQEFKARVLEAMGDGATAIVVDARNCGYIDSAGIGVLVSLAKRAKAQGGTFVIEGLQSDVRDYLALTKIDQVLVLR